MPYQSRQFVRKLALRAATTYAIVGFFWIAVTDQLLISLPPTFFTYSLHTLKGLSFVIVTGILLYHTLSKEINRWQSEVLAREKAEDSKKAFASSFATLFETAPLGFSIRRLSDGVVLHSNQHFSSLTLQPADQIRGATYHAVGLSLPVAPDATKIGTKEITLSLGSGMTKEILFSSEPISYQESDCALDMFIDISERKAAERFRLLNEERLRLAAEVAGVGTFDFDCRRDLIFLSSEAKQMLGGGGNDFISADAFIDKLVPQDHRLFREQLEQALSPNGNGRLQAECRILKQDGATVWISFLSKTFFEDTDGVRKAVRVIGAMRDITAIKLADETLRESEQRYRNLIEVSPDAIFLNQHNKIAFINRAGLKLLRATNYQQVVGRSPLDFVSPESQELVNSRVDELLQHPSQVPLVEQELIAIDGTRIPVETAAASYYSNGRLVIQVICREITVRKQAERALIESEQRFREVAETIQEVFWISDPETGHMLYVSPAYERIWGRSCKKLIDEPKSWWDSIHPEDVARLRASVSRQLDGTYDEEFRIILPGGETKWIRDRSFVSRDSHGDLLHVVGVAEDITARKHLEEQYREAQRLEAVGQLAAGVAHDFNNILGAIFGNLDLADLQPNIPEEVQKTLREIRGASFRAKALVQQVLTFAKQKHATRLVCDPIDAIHGVEGLLRAIVPKDIVITTACSDDAPKIVADCGQLEQAILNLALNGWHAHNGKPGAIAIEISSCLLGDGNHLNLPKGRYAKIAVRDKGDGIAPDIRPRIFEPFFTTKIQGQGTGLGLSVVHGIVKSHHGAIELDSSPGSGSTFFMYFPAFGVAAVTRDDALKAIKKSHKILIVDCDNSRLSTIGEALISLGHNVHIYSDRQTAMRVLREPATGFNLVLADKETARDLLINDVTVPVVALTDKPVGSNGDSISVAGIRELVLPPAPTEELAKTISENILGYV